ncbi:hypothetical protein DXG03_009551 [Asterophora parasitica]|uniref:Aminoglycoside phosphotransferase domain-containing protein n=1 Tax=Asterophora parasitica TaxID=117018 RepID=A0A9P7GAW7_9AGAR|nr:hypothetical protein DXG03_009551 [Asterophora parasitica]
MTSITATTENDLTTELGVKAYLADTPFSSETVTSLSGGTGNFAFRIHLATPFEGQETLVLKHAEPFIKNLPSIAFSLDRQTFEYEAMTHVKAWLPPDSLVTVPTIYKFDSEHNVLIMEDCGADTLTLKDFLSRGAASTSKAPGLAATIGAALGHFLGKMHTWSRANPSGILEKFAKNTQAVQLSAWATYGRLVSTLKPNEGDAVPPALANPPLAVSEADVDVVRTVAEEAKEAMLTARDVFVMGDFWPGNIMVNVDKEQRLLQLYVLDWELAKLGVPGVEIGQFCAEVDLLRRFIPSTEDSASTVLNTFLQAYAEEAIDNEQVARNALVHWGTHLVVWTPRVEWGDKEATRKVVKEGIQIIIAASGGTREEFRGSPVAPLVS